MDEFRNSTFVIMETWMNLFICILFRSVVHRFYFRSHEYMIVFVWSFFLFFVSILYKSTLYNYRLHNVMSLNKSFTIDTGFYAHLVEFLLIIVVLTWNFIYRKCTIYVLNGLKYSLFVTRLENFRRPSFLARMSEVCFYYIVWKLL